MINRFMSTLCALPLITMASGQTGSGPSAERLVYALDVQLTKYEWMSLETIRFGLTLPTKELFEGLKVRVFRGTLTTLESGGSPEKECRRFESLYFVPVVSPIRTGDSRNGEHGYSAVLDLQGAPTKEWLDLVGNTGSRGDTDYLIVFERSVGARLSGGDHPWIKDYMLIKKDDRSKYFRGYGIPIKVTRNIRIAGIGTSGSGNFGIVQPTPEERDVDCRALKTVDGGKILIQLAENCAVPSVTSSAGLLTDSETLFQ